MRILVVDDEVVALNSIRRLLKRRGLSTIQTRSLSAFAVKIWENDEAWAEYRENL
jgi:CheY-like chemotaxis protein